MPELYTTFYLLKRHGACGQMPGSRVGYDKLATALGSVRAWGKNTPIPLSCVVASNGIADTIWCLQALTPESPKWWKDYVLDCAQHVLPNWERWNRSDSRPRVAIATTRRYLRGTATLDEVNAATRAINTATYAINTATYAINAITYAAVNAAAYAATYATTYATTYAFASDGRWQTKRFLAYCNDTVVPLPELATPEPTAR